MHVVALNWRDLKNPRAGGAEVHMEEILRYLGRRGHRCTLITSRFPGAPAAEDVDGYRIVRGGHEYDFNLAVPFLFRRVAARDRPDILLDDINKVPFYSPLFTRVPVLAVIPHFMGTAVFREVNPVVAAAVYTLEQPVPGCTAAATSRSFRSRRARTWWRAATRVSASRSSTAESTVMSITPKGLGRRPRGRASSTWAASSATSRSITPSACWRSSGAVSRIACSRSSGRATACRHCARWSGASDSRPRCASSASWRGPRRSGCSARRTWP